MRNLYTWSLVIFGTMAAGAQQSQPSVAHQWNEALLHAIRHDFARPTVHARNLWHTSIALYDAWAAYTPAAENYFLGDTLGDYYCPFTGVSTPAQIQEAQEEAMSFAAYRLLRHRFQNSPGATGSLAYFDSLFTYLGHDPSNTSAQYQQAGPAELGNFIAQELIAFGLQDSSNEQNDYANLYYNPVNSPIAPVVAGSNGLNDPNRWQPITLNVFIDQSGNVIPLSTPPFLSPEWGWVAAFALHDSITQIKYRDGHGYPIFHDPPAPPLLDTTQAPATSANYEWGFRLVSKWSSHLDTTDNVMIDISPASIGNVPWYPRSMDSLSYFYDADFGGDIGTGHSLNPVTNQPYTPQMVRRGDYARVLAEFWADGPDSETPPGHWFTLLNYVSAHPQFEKRWRGQGPVLSDLEWDVKSYFTLGGAMHDAAVAAWSLKGYHDYLRPISAIRYMAERGQRSDSTLPNYDPHGIALDSGFVALVDSLDPLVGPNYEHLHKIKVNAWAGPDSISDPDTSMAGVSWILAENWWPYQRPTFVTPPFAGYVSGHSTFSRAAAEVMTAMTGDAYFPGGMGEFVAKKNEFLVFEEGPSRDVHLQWATYRDASDQCSLSRIWGGIHPPADDMPGRLLGIEIGTDAFHHARQYWENGLADVIALDYSTRLINDSLAGQNFSLTATFDKAMDTTLPVNVAFPVEDPMALTLQPDSMATSWLDEFHYRAVFVVNDSIEVLPDIDVELSQGRDQQGLPQVAWSAPDQFSIDMKNAQLLQLIPQPAVVADTHSGTAGFELIARFDKAMRLDSPPALAFPGPDPLTAGLSENLILSGWQDSATYRYVYDVADLNLEMNGIQADVDPGYDLAGNRGDSSTANNVFRIDTRNPLLTAITPSTDTITHLQAGPAGFFLEVTYDEAMDSLAAPQVFFPLEDPTGHLHYNGAVSRWRDSLRFRAYYDVDSGLFSLMMIDVLTQNARDRAGNLSVDQLQADLFHINITTGFDLPEDLLSGWSLFPNPIVRGADLHLETEGGGDYRFAVYNATGHRVLEGAGAPQLRVSTHNLAPGSYALVITNQGRPVKRWVFSVLP